MIARWFRLHLSNFSGALGRIGSSPVGAALNILVIAIALALPSSLQVLIANARSISPAFEDAADFTVYLLDSVDEDRGRSLAEEIRARSDVESTRFISRSEGLADFETWTGFEGALDALAENPIPQAVKVRPANDVLADIEALAEALGALDETASVQLDRLWVERLRSILALGSRSINMITVLLAAAVVLVIGNTVRLEINNRRIEIEVMKLVGATDGFIRRPFLYTGFVLGGLSAIVAALVIWAALLLLSGPVRDLAGLYSADFRLRGLGLTDLAVLIGGGALLGWAGAWIAAARHLKAIEPA